MAFSENKNSYYSVIAEGSGFAKSIMRNVGLTDKQVVKVVTIFQSLSRYSDFGSEYELFFSNAASQMGIDVPVKKVCTGEDLALLVNERTIDFEKPPQKNPGLKRGLKHGFYRMLTIPHILEGVIMNEYCDEVNLLIESDERVVKFKYPLPEDENKLVLPEIKRLGELIVSGIADHVGIIRGEEYDNEFYRNLVNVWKPDVYFVNSGISKEAQREFELRADLIGAELCITPQISRLHTSDFEKTYSKLKNLPKPFRKAVLS